MGAGRMFILNFSSQNNPDFMGLKISQIRQWSEMKGSGTGWGKMVTLIKVLSLATALGAIIEKFWVAWVSRLLENVLGAIVLLKMLSDTDAHT